MFKSISLLFISFASAHALAQIPMCNPTQPSNCGIKVKAEHGLRPSSSYTFTDEVPFKKCYSEADNTLADCFKEDSLLRYPYILADKNNLDALENKTPVEQAPVAILMIHGLSDGPYYNKPMGTFLHKKFGVPVVAIRLSGHGSVLPVHLNVNGQDKVVLSPQPADLGKRDQNQWYQDVSYGYEIAKKLGKKVIVTGFSLGGVLTVNLYKKRASENRIAGMLLFSPALGLPLGVAQLTCTAAHLQSLQGKIFTADENFKGGGNLIRYLRMAYAGACNIQHITAETQAIKSADQIKVPTFALLSTADTAIDRDGLENFMSNLKVPKKFFVINKKPDLLDLRGQFWKNILARTDSSFIEYHEVEKPVDHSWVMLDPNNAQDAMLSQQVNPVFKEASLSVCNFLKTNIKDLPQNVNCNN